MLRNELNELEEDVKFDYLNLYTKFSYRFGKVGEKIVAPYYSKASSRRHPCFGELFRDLDQHTEPKKTYHIRVGIILNKNTENVTRGNVNNLVLVDKETIKEHINYLRDIINIEHKIIDKGDDFWVILDITGRPIQIKYACCWVRYLYEYPANVFMADYYRLRDQEDWAFKEELPENLIMAMNCLTHYLSAPSVSIRYDQCLSLSSKFYTRKELLAEIKKGPRRLSDMYKSLYYLGLEDSCRNISFRLFDNDMESKTRRRDLGKDIKSLRFWLSGDSLRFRRDIYDQFITEFIEESKKCNSKKKEVAAFNVDDDEVSEDIPVTFEGSDIEEEIG